MNPAILLGMIRGVERIAGALLRRAPYEIITLYEPASRLLASSGIAHRQLDEFVSDADRNELFRRAEQRAQAIAQQIYSEDFRAQWPQIDDLTWPSLRDQLVVFLKRDLTEEMYLVDALHRCVRRVDLRLLLTPEDYGRDTRAAILTAQRLGVPSLHLLHGYPYQTQNAHDVVAANVVAAFSEPCKKVIESFGARPDRVVVTGNPMWDVYAEPVDPNAKPVVCARLGLDPHRPIIEYAMTGVHRFSAISQTYSHYHLQTAEAVVDGFAALAKRHPDWQFLLRPHPIEPIDVAVFQDRARSGGLDQLVIDNESTADVLNVPDVFLCTHSNMGIEAILRGIPVINVALDVFGGPVFREGIGPFFVEEDAVLHVTRCDDIPSQVEAALLDEPSLARLAAARPETIRRLNFANDGRAAERLCALALDMIANNAKYVDPIRRYPEFEPAFAQAMPADARRVLVVGRAAAAAMLALQGAWSSLDVTSADTVDAIEGSWDAIVFSDPLPHTGATVNRLRHARQVAGDSAVIIAAFRHGGASEALDAFAAGEWVPPRPHGEAPAHVGQFSRVGVEVVLSRSDLEPQTWIGIREFTGSVEEAADFSETKPHDKTVEGWVVCARPRPKRASPFAAERLDRRRRAALANRMGERRFAKGDVTGAVAAFADAIKLWNEDARYFSNLAATLFSAQQLDNAWYRIREAIYLDPRLPVVRANYRMIANAIGKLDEAEHVLSLFGTDEPSES